MSEIANKLLEQMQAELASVDEDSTRIKGQIDALEVCDLGFPLTVEEILCGIGRGKLAEPAFRPGCTVADSGWDLRGTQPGHVESMGIVRDVVTGHVKGTLTDELLAQFPSAADFINRAAEWLGPPKELTDLQRLLIERMLLPFEWWATEDTHAMCHLWGDEAKARVDAVFKDLSDERGRGAAIDAKIEAEIAQLAEATDEAKQQWRNVHGFVARGEYGFCDCHHDVFRNIENWIYGIGTGNWGIPSRKPKTERKRLERALLAYAIGTDRWLLGVPMPLVLLDLGHVDLGFDPRNEILRVYAYLGDERTPTKEWLVACLWKWLHAEGERREETRRAKELGVSTRQWLDSMTGSTGYIRDWLICGPFPSEPLPTDELARIAKERPDDAQVEHLRAGHDTDYLEAVGGEAVVHPAEGDTVVRPDGAAVQWCRYTSDDEPVMFEKVLGEQKASGNVAYAYTTIYSEKSADAYLSLGLVGSLKVYFNGQLLHNEHLARSASRGSILIPVALTEGINTVLVKVDNDAGSGGFIAQAFTTSPVTLEARPAAQDVS